MPPCKLSLSIWISFSSFFLISDFLCPFENKCIKEIFYMSNPDQGDDSERLSATQESEEHEVTLLISSLFSYYNTRGNWKGRNWSRNVRQPKKKWKC